MKLNTILPIFYLFTVFGMINFAYGQSSSGSSTSFNQQQISKEAKDNQTIYNNAEATKASAKDSYVKLMGNKDGSAATVTNLTDEQKVLSENFVHQGKANRVLTEKCAGNEMQDICSGQDPNSGRKAIIDGVAKAYAVFGSMMDDKFLALKKSPSTDKVADAKTPDAKAPDAKGPDAKPADAKGTEKKDDSQTDYCKYIPVATETISMYMQQSAGKLITLPTSSGETAQKETILKAAKNHEERAKGAQIQAGGWWGTAGCYGVMAATGTAMNPAWMIKIGAAAFLGGVYQNEVSQNNEYAAKTRAVADLLPGKGDCNPVTQKACYCAQPETENDTTYCFTELHKKALAANAARVTCVDNTMKADPSCSCEKTNTCFDRFMINQDVNNNLGFGSGAGSPLNSVRQLTHGELQGGRLAGTSYAQTSAIAKRAMANANKIPGPNQNLSPSENKLAAMYQNAGIPGNIAAHMAAMNVSKGALDAAMAKAQGTSGYVGTVAYSPNGGSRNIDFSGGSGLNKGKAAAKNEDPAFKFGNLLKKPDANNNSRSIEFAVQKAQQQNQISKTDHSIFEIISNRYAGSAIRMLDLENKN